MARVRITAGVVVVGLLVAGGKACSATPAQILQYRPRQEGIAYSTPRPEEYGACRVQWTKPPAGPGQWLLVDAQGRPLRRLLDTNGDNKPDIWCYYLDGVEVYREIDTDFDGEPDQFRWLNSAGMKWGVDVNHDHKIDTWRMISAEEVSQEIVMALAGQDFARLQALFLNEPEMQALGLPPAEIARINELEKLAAGKFQATVSKLTSLGNKTRWLHLETTAPQCVPADAAGGKQDLIKYGRGTILCETEGKNDWIQTGELFKVGLAWRIIDAPVVGDGTGDSTTAATDPALQPLLDQLRELDQKAPRGADGAAAAELVTYNLARADLLEQIRAKVKAEEREQWVRQIADCLSAASQSSPENERTAYERLTALEKQVAADSPGSPLVAYVTFREMQADNAAKLAKPGPDIAKVQERWLERLSQFISTYPQAEDAPEALMQLGMVSEFIGKEIEAKNWYARLVKDFAQHPMAAKAQGALRRIELEGKPLELSGTLLDGTAFNIEQLRSKMVVVYYWASWNKDRCIGDFAVLKQLLDSYGPKGLALVTVNLDNTAEEANAFLQRTPAPGSFHLFQPGGLESPLATQYGVMVLPNLFLVDKEGKVISRTLQQVNGLEDEVKKRLE